MTGAKSLVHLLSPISRLAFTLTPPQIQDLTGIETDYMAFWVGKYESNKVTMISFNEALSLPFTTSQLVSLQGFSEQELIATACKQGLTTQELNGRFQADFNGETFSITHSKANQVIELTSKQSKHTTLKAR